MTLPCQNDKEEMRLALGSLIDMFDELIMAMYEGTKPDQEWVTLAQKVLDDHRANLGFRKDT